MDYYRNNNKQIQFVKIIISRL